MPKEEEDCCLTDALLPDVLERGREERQKFHSLAEDPEENWLDGFVAGCFVGIFMMPPRGIAQEKEEEKEDAQTPA